MAARHKYRLQCQTINKQNKLPCKASGIRMNNGNDEQKRTASPLQAISSGANFLVIGRPITIGNPLKNIKEIIDSLN